MNPPLTMIALTSRFTDDDGTVLEHRTWAVGDSKSSALAQWKRQCPLMAGTLVGVTVVTPVAQPRERLVGPRSDRTVLPGQRR